MTFTEWEESATAIWQVEFGIANRNQRACYIMQGIEIMVEDFFPWSPFADATHRVIVDIPLAPDDPIRKTVEDAGGWLEEVWYGEDGWDWPVFGGEEKAWNFIKEWKCTSTSKASTP